MAAYILFDTETTGTTAEDRIIQIGAIILANGKTETYNELCKAPIDIKIEAMEVHGITPKMVENKPSFEETAFYKRIQELNSEENFLIAHNLPFDLSMLEKEGFVCQMQKIDTLRASRHIFDESPHHRLQYFRYALELYNKEKEEAAKHNITINAHDALSDVVVMKLFLSALKQKTQEKHPEENPITVLVELSDTPVIIKVFKFGKYKDRLIQEVAAEDPGYINWMLTKMEDLDDDLRYTLEFL